MKTWTKQRKNRAVFKKKIENFLNGKIRAAPLAAATHISTSSELLPLFLFYLAAPYRAAPRRASVQWPIDPHACAHKEENKRKQEVGFLFTFPYIIFTQTSFLLL